MKKILVLLTGLFIAFSGSAKNYSLTGDAFRLKPFAGQYEDAWTTYQFDDSSWLSQKQPAQWQMLPQFEWKYGGKMFYRARFNFKPEPGKNYFLRFNGVFYYAKVWLNGELLGTHAGYFAPFEFRVSGRLKEKNILAIEVDCPYEEGEHLKRHVTGVFGYWDVISWKRNPGGIWREVEIVETGSARLENVWLGTTRLEGNNAEVRLFGWIIPLPRPPVNYTITLDLAPENFSGKSFHFEFPVSADRGVRWFTKTFTLENPALWNTWDRGKPNLYKATVKAMLDGGVQDREEFITGIRTIEKRCQKGQWQEGLCWEFALNGRPIYIRGNNYAPADAYMARALPETYKKDIALARESYYNMIRVHAHIDRPELYDECDRAGIMVWQDFPLQGMYAHEQGILEEASNQAPEMVYLLGSHPSVVFYSCQNEPALTANDWNVRVMDKKLKKILEAADPTRPVNLGSGIILMTDAHLYYGWYISEADGFIPAMHYPFLKESMAFITEFGAQAFPDYEDSIKFMDPDINKLDWKDLQEHYVLQKSNMDKYVPVRPGWDLKTYINATQEYQARIQKFHIDWIRSVKYKINWGMVTFLFNDANPAITWAVVDYWRNPKQAYYAIQQAFQPIYAFTTWRFGPYQTGKTISLPVFVVNDLLQSYSAKVSAEVSHQGNKILEKSWAVKLEPDMPAKKIGAISFKPESAGDYELKITLTAPGLEKPAQNLTVLKVGVK